MTKYVVDLLRDPQYINEDLKHLRIWLDGYKANGGDMPLGVDVIRQLQVVMSNVQAPTSGDDNTAARARVIDGFDGIQDILDKAVQSFLDYDKAISILVPITTDSDVAEYRYTIRYNYPPDTVDCTWFQYATSNKNAEDIFKRGHPSAVVVSVVVEL